MGCESSKTANESLSHQRRNTLIVKPKAAIQVDEGVKLRDEKGTILIFIFGKFFNKMLLKCNKGMGRGRRVKLNQTNIIDKSQKRKYHEFFYK